ncbi:MAG TPA: Hpt domain-containing protein [Thermoanaerobaculia bacterium]|nr:Hpt domain-containing protein [Thermoanaerobaculia bacterium]
MVDHELNELRQEFLDEARGKVEEMQATYANGGTTAEVLERVAYLAHQLKGSGGSYGYQQISDDAAELEKAVESLAGQNGDGAFLDEKIRKHVLNLQNEIESAARELA